MPNPYGDQVRLLVCQSKDASRTPLARHLDQIAKHQASAGMRLLALGCLVVVLLSLLPASAAAQQAKDADKKLKNRSLSWSPPDLDSRVRGLAASSACDLDTAREQAAERTSNLINVLQNFTAREKIAFQSLDREGFVTESGSEAFNYIVIFNKEEGEPVIEERRNPVGGSSSAMAGRSRGLPEMVLMFLPNLQGDYEMKCDGETTWQGQRSWVVHFQQRSDKPSRTFSFSSPSRTYSASLKGHAWIAADSGEVMHLEVGLMHGIPALKVFQWSLSIDYAPVRFQTKDVKLWLPETADAYFDFGDHRTVVFHTFGEFLLFSVDTHEKIEKPN
jgi:hypothetical protein